jgi:hypothetical protein
MLSSPETDLEMGDLRRDYSSVAQQYVSEQIEQFPTELVPSHLVPAWQQNGRK